MVDCEKTEFKEQPNFLRMPTQKKTKIVATLGPATSQKAILKEMILAGADVFRINFSHAVPEDVIERIAMIRELNEGIEYECFHTWRFARDLN